jgi:hypothetical protein
VDGRPDAHGWGSNISFPFALQAYNEYNACMKSIQYTIRGITRPIDDKIRERAARDGKSLNETVLEVLKSGLGIGDSQVRYNDLDDLAGTWVSDPEFDRVIEEMDRVDPDLWK